MSDTVNKLFFTGYQGVDIIRHLVKGHAESLEARHAIEMDALAKMAFAEALCGGFDSQHILPVRTHPDKHRKSQ